MDTGPKLPNPPSTQAQGEERLSIDATSQTSPPLRGRGPFPHSDKPGHSGAFPVELELIVPTGELRPDGTILVDFLLTNVGSESLYIPVQVNEATLLNGNENPAFALDVLTLYLTSPGIHNEDVDLINPATGEVTKMLQSESLGTSSELYGREDDPRTLHKLETNGSIRVHASSRVRFKAGTWAITAHAELLRVANGRSEEIGTADAVPIAKTLPERESTGTTPN